VTDTDALPTGEQHNANILKISEICSKVKRIQREIDRTQDELERGSMAVMQQLGACIKTRVDALRR
jgi:hypothetical protein